MIDDVGLTLGQLIARTSASDPDRLALRWNGQDTTYGAFDERTFRSARAWKSLGVAAGHRVAFIMDNSPQLLDGFVGLSRLGATTVALNTQLSTEDLAYQILDSGARYVFTSPEHADLAANALASAGSAAPLVSTSETGTGIAWPQVMGAAESTPIDRASPADPLSIIYTSGTTGRPKGVVHSHQSLISVGQGYASWLGLGATDRFYVCLPLCHINAQGYGVLGALAAQGSLILAPRYSRSRFWDDVITSGVTVTNLISLMLAVLTDLGDDDLAKAETLRVVYGSAVGRLTHVERSDLESRLGVILRTGYGMSETAFGFIEPLTAPLAEGSVGRVRHHPNPAVARSQARVVRPDGVGAKPGEVGELALRNPAMMLGYLRDGAPDASILDDGWLMTGDQFRFDDQGNYFFEGRGFDVIRRRGEKISAVELEHALRRDPAVAEAAVIGVPADVGDDEIYAFVVQAAGPPLSEADVLEHLSTVLPPFKLPRYVEFTAELPRTATEKVAKGELLKRAMLTLTTRTATL